MAEPLRHRQTKGAETDMFGLQQPRHISTLPNSAVVDIRPERQLSGDKLPPPSQRAVCGTTIFPLTRKGTYTAHRPRASVTVIAWGAGASVRLPARSSRAFGPDLRVGVRDIAIELSIVGLAKHGPLVGLRELAEEKRIRRRAPDGVEPSSLPPLTFCESPF
jgi:hypothetical protein